MDKIVGELLTKLGSFGYVLIVLIVACPLIYKLIAFLKNKRNEHDGHVRDQLTHEQEVNDLVGQLTELVGAVNQVQGTVESVAAQNIELQEQFATEISNLNNKIDSNHVESVNGDKQIIDDIKAHDVSLADIKDKMDRTDQKMNLLIDSNKESNKAIITNMFYEHVEEKGFIPVFKLQIAESVYKKYLEENGDTFVEHLMEELRKLPHEAPKKDEG